MASGDHLRWNASRSPPRFPAPHPVARPCLGSPLYAVQREHCELAAPAVTVWAWCVKETVLSGTTDADSGLAMSLHEQEEEVDYDFASQGDAEQGEPRIAGLMGCHRLASQPRWVAGDATEQPEALEELYGDLLPSEAQAEEQVRRPLWRVSLFCGRTNASSLRRHRRRCRSCVGP